MDKVMIPDNDISIRNEDIIADRIFWIRGVQVMLDTDIALLFQVDVKRLNQQMKRNQERFPEDFCFRLTEEEIYLNIYD